MKKNVKVTKNNILLYEGKLIDLPIKDEYITQKSIDLFDDDDPCIIHKSYVLKGFADEMITLFKTHNTTILKGDQHLEFFSCVDFTEPSKLVFEIKE